MKTTTKKKTTKKTPAKKSALTITLDLAKALTAEQLAVIRLGDATSLTKSVIETLRTVADRRIEAERERKMARVPLISERYVGKLAGGLAVAMFGDGVKTLDWDVPLNVDTTHGPLLSQWASVARSTLESAYMMGATAEVELHASHPGSREGLVVVDLRKFVDDFSDTKGVVTLNSMLARVAGKAKP